VERRCTCRQTVDERRTEAARSRIGANPKVEHGQVRIRPRRYEAVAGCATLAIRGGAEDDALRKPVVVSVRPCTCSARCVARVIDPDGQYGSRDTDRWILRPGRAGHNNGGKEQSELASHNVMYSRARTQSQCSLIVRRLERHHHIPHHREPIGANDTPHSTDRDHPARRLR
jgi:hypothetical protein